MKNNINKIFNKRACLSAAELEGYVRNTLKPRERNQVERHLLDCELCSEALEGFMDSGKDISLLKLKSALAHRLVVKNNSGSKAGSKRNGWIWAAAAVICIAMVSGVVWKFHHQKKNELAVVQVKDSIQEPVQSLPLSAEESTFSSTVANAEVKLAQMKSHQITEAPKTETPQEEAKIAAAVQEPAVIVQDEGLTFQERVDDLRTKEMQATSQPATHEMPGNAPQTTAADNQASSNRSATKKKNETTNIHNLSETEGSVSWNQIFGLAEQGQYQKALLAVEQLKTEKDELKKNYYRGFFLYKLERYNEALMQFDKLQKNKLHPNFHDAQFYSAMSLINTGKNKEGKEILNRIVNGKLPHHEHAAEMLRLLD